MESSASTGPARHLAEQQFPEQNKPITKPQLLIEGPKYSSFDFTKSSTDNQFIIGNVPLYLFEETTEHEAKTDLEKEEHTVRTAGSVWDCGIILAKYLEKHSDELDLAHKRVIELGAGKSLPGLAASLLGSNVVLTDHPAVIYSISRIVASNNLSNVKVLPLDWMDRDKFMDPVLESAEGPFDIVLCADVVWVEWLIGPLVDTIATLVKEPSQYVLLAHQSRSRRADEALFATLQAEGFRWESLEKEEFWKESVVIYKLWRK